MSRSDNKGPKLPRGLLDQLGSVRQNREKRNKFNSTRQDPHKDRRKAQRTEKRHSRSQDSPFQRPTPSKVESDEFSGFDSPAASNHLVKGPRKAAKKESSGLKQATRPRAASADSEESSPRPSLSRAVKERLAEDDADIAALEKRLGINSGNISSKGLQEDGLDFLLEGLGDSDPNQKRKRGEYDEYLLSKRQKNAVAKQSLSADDGIEWESSDGDVEHGDDSESVLDDGPLGRATESDEETSNKDDREASDGYDGVDLSTTSVNRKRENPYVAPVTNDETGTAKYVPPSLRQASAPDAGELARIKRQVQGLLNRLSEANSVTIVRDIERLYQGNPRQYVTTAVVDLLLTSLATKTRLNDTFIILHAGFVAGLFKATGVDFGAYLIERAVTEFDRAYSLELQDQDSKVAANLIALIATLYIFQVITATLVFDYVRIFLHSVSETNTELLLLLVRSCGIQLRQDDPSSLKDIVAMLHSAVAEAGESNLSVRTKFMIETVNNLKNNRAKAGATASAVVGEHITRMKKAVGSITSRKASEPLRLSLSDIRNADKKGKWWLVGASWKGEEKREQTSGLKATTGCDDSEMLNDSSRDPNGEADLINLAKNLGMNTEIRRAIFISIMSATDIKDAQYRLLKLHLKKAQEMEIPRVLITCAGGEQTYNQYYALIAQRLCAQDRRIQKAFQFSLWDLFKRMGEKSEDDMDDDDDDEEIEQSMTTRQIVNFGKMFGTLIRKGALSITSLRVLRFGMLRSKTTAFLEVLFVTIFEGIATHSTAERWQNSIARIFEDARLASAIIPGLQKFLEDLVRGKALKSGKNAKAVRQCCRLAVEELRRLTEHETRGEL